MTTITKEEVKAFIEQIESDLANGWEAQIFELKLARIALASLNATPIYQVQYGQQWRDVSKEVYEDHRDHGSSTRIVYAEPPAPVTGIYDDVLNIIGLLENNEWAEHCTSTVLGSLLKSEITRLVSKEKPVPVVSFYRDGIEAAASWVDKQRQAFDNEHGRYDSDTGAFEFGNDAQRDYSDTLAELADGIRGLHPNAGDNSPVTPDGWISCSERMPDNDESKPIAIFTGKCLGQGMFVATYDDDAFFDYWEGMEIIGVTHWMPLPEPPQK
ncbi:DUF551 domain-containing protein [Salmonella enterica subsp. enterica]|nr:DUF551 domain-containing protein [Salmonella enterica subsp. enterica]ECV5256741.1 DUF551 domain-containing protein [Salmonella enterica subsp. houtenae]EDR0192094.1 DUF551 domain-containing protein [Salmonella enterica subsp. houtenae]EDV4890527.1 DUF551 domain-containing protein [Salmonella enterica subsp. enterica]